MTSNFNAEHKGFALSSKAFASIKADLEVDESYMESDADGQAMMQKAILATFEAAVVFSSLAPAQTASILRGGIGSFGHENLSAQSNAFIKVAAKQTGFDKTRFPKTFAILCMTRPANAKSLAQDLADWDAKLNEGLPVNKPSAKKPR